MGLFKKRTTDPEELERLKSEIALMGARLSASDQQKQELGEQVRGLVSRLDTPIAPPPTTPPPPAPPTVDVAQIDKLNAKIQRLSLRIDDVDNTATTAATAATAAAPSVDPAHIEQLDQRMQSVSARIDEIDQRITAISTELANQLRELSGELDSMGASDQPDGEVVGELREAQLRLAEEQARYQIAFRQDLADLADRLKRA